MKYVIALSLLCFSSCVDTEPKTKFPNIKFGKKVSIINGFYQGQTGTVIGYTLGYSTACPKGYKVKLNSTLTNKSEFVCAADVMAL